MVLGIITVSYDNSHVINRNIKVNTLTCIPSNIKIWVIFYPVQLINYISVNYGAMSALFQFKVRHGLLKDLLEPLIFNHPENYHCVYTIRVRFNTL